MDGSYGEGGGQILRTAVCLSMVVGVPIHVTSIRAGRSIPGLRPQHSETIKILAKICSARVEGAGIGSTELRFHPGEVEEEGGRFDLGTAASIPLVLQAVVPAVSLMGRAFEIELVGGTDVPWSPTSDYLERVVLPAMKGVGIGFTFKVGRRGYYPNGGGTAKVRVDPCSAVKGMDLSAPRGGPLRVSTVSRCGRLPQSVAERQAKAAGLVLERADVEVSESEVRVEQSASPGSSVMVSHAGGGSYLGGDSIGAHGRPAETVGRAAAERFLAAYRSGARVDANLADMLAPILALSWEPSALRIPFVTEHLRTSLHVAAQFTTLVHSFEQEGGSTILRISPGGAK